VLSPPLFCFCFVFLFFFFCFFFFLRAQAGFGFPLPFSLACVPGSRTPSMVSWPSPPPFLFFGSGQKPIGGLLFPPYPSPSVFFFFHLIGLRHLFPLRPTFLSCKVMPVKNRFFVCFLPFFHSFPSLHCFHDVLFFLPFFLSPPVLFVRGGQGRPAFFLSPVFLLWGWDFLLFSFPFSILSHQVSPLLFLFCIPVTSSLERAHITHFFFFPIRSKESLPSAAPFSPSGKGDSHPPLRFSVGKGALPLSDRKGRATGTSFCSLLWGFTSTVLFFFTFFPVPLVS